MNLTITIGPCMINNKKGRYPDGGRMELIPGQVPHTKMIIEQFISARFSSSGADLALIGLSGGLDSALLLELMCSALGKEKVRAFFLPCGDLSMNDREFAAEAARSCDIEVMEIDISPIVESVPIGTDGMIRGNLMARARMIYLYTFANKNNGLVFGTSNKTELLMGYFTKYGDGAADIYPIGDLFKTQVRELASDIGIPGSIIDRAPSAGLVHGQTDEGEMGVPYPILDQILKGYIIGLQPDLIADNIDHTSTSIDEMDRAGFEPPVEVELVTRIIETVKATRHKRHSLAIPKVDGDTIGIDLRERW